MVRDWWVKCLASACGFGYFPVASGTAGTVFAVGFYALLVHIIGGPQNVCLYLLATAIVTLIGIWAAGEMMVLLNSVDPKPIVIDEVAGYLVTMTLVPFTCKNMLLGFLLFRLFDIWKPWPARWFDDIHDGWGIGVTLDDVAAGVYCCLLMHLYLQLL